MSAITTHATRSEDGKLLPPNPIFVWRINGLYSTGYAILCSTKVPMLTFKQRRIAGESVADRLKRAMETRRGCEQAFLDRIAVEHVATCQEQGIPH